MTDTHRKAFERWFYSQWGHEPDGGMGASAWSSWCGAIRTMEKRLEILQHERDHARACGDRCVQILSGIHALLYPPTHTNDENVTFVFHSPYVHEQMQALSDRIRAIPDAIRHLIEQNEQRDSHE